MDNITSINGSMGWIINGYTIQWLSNDYPEIDGIWTFENIPMLMRFLKRLQYILLQGDHMGMDQYLLIPFLVGWTSIYQLFWCSPGVQGFDTLPYIHNISTQCVYILYTCIVRSWKRLTSNSQRWCQNSYPLVNIQKTMENHHLFMGKSTISMAIFNSYVSHYQRVFSNGHRTSWFTHLNSMVIFSSSQSVNVSTWGWSAEWLWNLGVMVSNVSNQRFLWNIPVIKCCNILQQSGKCKSVSLIRL